MSPIKVSEAILITDLKRPTKELVIKERLANPHASQREIGDKVGVSAQMVSLILVSAKLPTRKLSKHAKVKYICNYCGSLTHASIYPILFCSPECRKRYSMATVRCDMCGMFFRISYSSLRKRVVAGYKHLTCSRSCKGFVKRSNAGKTKWALFIPSINEMLQQNRNISDIGKDLKIPAGTISNLRRRRLIGRTRSFYQYSLKG